MLLATDAGNTNIVFAVYDGDQIRGSWRISTEAKRTADEYGAWLLQLLARAGIGAGDLTRGIIASVVPEAVFALRGLYRTYFGLKPILVGERPGELAIEVRLPRPEEVGADRLVNAIAACDRYRPPLVIVDFGTATTFDYVDRDGAYAGGVIAPGINLSLQALYMAAAKLPLISVRRTEKVIGTNTVSSMQSGVFWGYVGLIEGLIGRMHAEVGQSLTVIGTGGLAPLFNEATGVIDHVDDDLTLWGLRLIDRRENGTS